MSTETPGSIVTLAPLVMSTSPLSTYGESATVHVMSDEIVPETGVGPVARAAQLPNASSAHMRATTYVFVAVRTAMFCLRDIPSPNRIPLLRFVPQLRSQTLGKGS
jgi:hypothetical protein